MLKLYVVGNGPRSRRAIRNLVDFCRLHARDADVEFIDLYEHPARSVTANVVAAPTLVRERPLPERRLVGDLSDAARIRDALLSG